MYLSVLIYSRIYKSHVEGPIEVQCFPLYSVLMAIGNPTVDYFSLDIEGAEFQVF